MRVFYRDVKLQPLTRSKRSSRLPVILNPLHFKHRSSCSIVYCFFWFLFCLFCCYVVSSTSSPFRRLRQADPIVEGKARPQHRELHALLFSTCVGSLTSHRVYEH